MKLSTKIIVICLAIILFISTFLGGFFYGGVYYKINSIAPRTSFDEIYSILSNYHYTLPSDEILLDGAIDGMIASLDDPYTYYFEYQESPSDGEAYIGLGITIVFDQENLIIYDVIEDSPADIANLAIRDIIVAINDESVLDLTLTELSSKIKGNIGDVKKLTIKRGSLEFDVDITLALISNPTVTYHVYDEVAYLKINTFTGLADQLFEDYLVDVDNAYQNSLVKGLIVDVRDNGGGSLSIVVNILKHFLTQKPAGENNVYLTMESKNKTEDELRTYNPVVDNIQKPYPIKVLMNGNSASASEIFIQAMCGFEGYQSFGENSFGKGIFQVDFSLTSMPNYYLHITTGKWYTHNDLNITKENTLSPTNEVLLPEYFSSYLPIYEKDYSIDMVDLDIKNIQIILTSLGYIGRTDGYFDSNMQNYIIDNYNLLGLIDENTLNLIMSDYLLEIKDYQNDTQLMAAINAILVE